MDDEITVETDLFEHREVKPHFINPCCFGEDFVAWLLTELAPLIAGGLRVLAAYPGRLRLGPVGQSRQGSVLGSAVVRRRGAH